MDEIVLIYTGDGRQHIVGIPARDLSADELAALMYTEERLANSDIYERAGRKSAKAGKTKEATKTVEPEIEQEGSDNGDS